VRPNKNEQDGMASQNPNIILFDFVDIMIVIFSSGGQMQKYIVLVVSCYKFSSYQQIFG